MPDSTNQKAAEAIARQISAYLGSTIEPGFVVIRYPPGFNFNVQYGASAYWNPRALALVDQLCASTGPGTASLTGASFSAKYAAILGAVGYSASAADNAAQTKASKAFSEQQDKVVDAFEDTFGRIRRRDIQTSACRPPTKAGYVTWYVQNNYPGTPPTFPPLVAAFGAAYAKWFAMGEQLQKMAGREQAALNLVAASTADTVTPGAQNGALQTGADSWSVCYALPDNNTILSSLRDPGRSVTVSLELQSDSNHTVSLRLDNQDIGSIPNSGLSIAVAPPGAAKAAGLDNLWDVAQKVEMQIAYSGITVIRADPREISADLKTGWYCSQIVADIVAKTGKDVTGLKLQGSTFSVDDLFGRGKSFARVRTFVISQEPTVTLTFRGAGVSALAARFPKDQPARIDLDEIVTFGSTSADYNVLDVTTGADTVTVRLGPPAPVGTVPAVDQTAHVIGGVVVYPPDPP